MTQASSWRARLELGFTQRHGRTVLSHRKHIGPLIVQRPFYPEGGTCHVYLVHPPGGIVGGDQVALEANLHAGSHALITTPAATRFYRAGPHPAALLQQQLTVRDATLEWLPQETIVFDGAKAINRTLVNLHGSARFAGWEVTCLGRPENRERLLHGSLSQDIQLHLDGKPVLLDRLRLQGGSPALDSRWGLQGAQALGTLLVYPAMGTDLASLRALQQPGVRHALTQVQNLLVCRAMAEQAEPVRQLFTAMWLQLRPALLGREAVAPRIWAT